MLILKLLMEIQTAKTFRPTGSRSRPSTDQLSRCAARSPRFELPRLDARELDNLGPLFGFIDQKFAEIGGRNETDCRAQIHETRF